MEGSKALKIAVPLTVLAVVALVGWVGYNPGPSFTRTGERAPILAKGRRVNTSPIMRSHHHDSGSTLQGCRCRDYWVFEDQEFSGCAETQPGHIWCFVEHECGYRSGHEYWDECDNPLDLPSNDDERVEDDEVEILGSFEAVKVVDAEGYVNAHAIDFVQDGVDELNTLRHFCDLPEGFEQPSDLALEDFDFVGTGRVSNAGHLVEIDLTNIDHTIHWTLQRLNYQYSMFQDGAWLDDPCQITVDTAGSETEVDVNAENVQQAALAVVGRVNNLCGTSFSSSLVMAAEMKVEAGVVLTLDIVVGSFEFSAIQVLEWDGYTVAHHHNEDFLDACAALHQQVQSLSMTEEKVEYINNEADSWQARYYEQMGDGEHVTKLMGSHLLAPHLEDVHPLNLASAPHSYVPGESFDLRLVNPTCFNGHRVRHQGNCGSCWAFATSTAFANQLCYREGLVKEFSPQELVNCEEESNACKGGFTSAAWAFYQSEGGTYEENLSYEGEEGACYSRPTNAAAECNSFQLAKTVRDIQYMIETRGPVTASFDVYSDFMSYYTGVYSVSPSATKAGGHAVQLIGWGVDNNKPYWIGENSWGNDWGEGVNSDGTFHGCGNSGGGHEFQRRLSDDPDCGYFRFLRGTNEAGIEDRVGSSKATLDHPTCTTSMSRGLEWVSYTRANSQGQCKYIWKSESDRSCYHRVKVVDMLDHSLTYTQVSKKKTESAEILMYMPPATYHVIRDCVDKDGEVVAQAVMSSEIEVECQGGVEPQYGVCAHVDCGVGTCNEHHGTCVCPAGWSGDRCENAPSHPCDNVDCNEPFGECVDGQCECRGGWGGAHCDEAPEFETVCTDTCDEPWNSDPYTNYDGYCQDSGQNTRYSGCRIGTDCTDCGPRYLEHHGTVEVTGTSGQCRYKNHGANDVTVHIYYEVRGEEEQVQVTIPPGYYYQIDEYADSCRAMYE